MDIRQEKEYIYGMMQDITLERRNLSELYFDLKKRLDRLDDIEMRGLDEVSVDGYFNLHEQRQRKTSASNIRREIDYLDRKTNPTTQVELEKPEYVTPVYQPSPTEVKAELEKSIQQLEKQEEPEQKIPKPIIEEAKAQDKANKSVNKTKKKKKRSSLDFTKVGAVIRIILKESGRPMKLKEIHEQVQEMMEEDITLNNFRQNLMYRANKEYKDIVRVGTGIYEFVSDEAERKRKELIHANTPKEESTKEKEDKQEKFELQTVE